MLANMADKLARFQKPLLQKKDENTNGLGGEDILVCIQLPFNALNAILESFPLYMGGQTLG